MRYEDVEKEIRDRLQAKFGPHVSVIVLPENEAEFKRPVERSQVTVAYQGSEYELDGSTRQPLSLGLGAVVIQEETVLFEIVIQAKKLRGTNQLYDIIGRVKRALVGYRFTDCEKMKVRKIGFVQRDEGIFTYTLTMSTLTMVVEDPDEVAEPLIKRIDGEGLLGEFSTDNLNN
jgi:hypothetical protein